MNIRLLIFSRHALAVLSLFLVFGMGDGRAALEDFSEQSITLNVPVVLSASRLRQPLSDAPNAVTVIDRAMIKASGFRNIADLFNLVPGMYVSYFNGHTPFVSYHGTTDELTRRMQVLVDGRSVYLPPFNSVEWVDLPLHIDDIERIEVVRGPAATSYGSNSIFGVINITTRDASALNGASISATKGNAGGGNGASDAVVRFGKSGDQLDYRFTFSTQNDNGLKYPANGWNFYGVYNDSHTTQIANLRTNYHPNGIDSFDLQLGFNYNSRADGDPRSFLSQPHYINDSSGYQQLNWLHVLDQNDDIQLHYYHISRNSTSENSTLPAIAGHYDPAGARYSIGDIYTVHRHEFELQHTVHTNPGNRLVWGMATRYESVAAPSLFLAPQSSHQPRIFAHDEWRILPPLLLNIGAMFEDDGMGHKKLSPRAALNYHVTPEHTFRTSISVAYRNPALAEEFGNLKYWVDGIYQLWHSSGGLRPERTLSREIGYLGNFSNGWSIDARVYSDQASDIIWTDYSLGNPASVKTTYGFPLVWDFRNEFAARYTGLEGTAKYKWGNRNSLTLNYTHQNVSCDPVGVPYLASTPLGPVASAWYAGMVKAYIGTIPVNSGSLLYTGQMDDGISFSAGYYQQGSNMGLGAMDPQPLNRRVDMRVAKQFGSSGKIGGGEVALVVQNAFQNENIGYSGYSFDRRAYLTATVNF